MTNSFLIYWPVLENKQLEKIPQDKIIGNKEQKTYYVLGYKIKNVICVVNFLDSQIDNAQDHIKNLAFYTIPPISNNSNEFILEIIGKISIKKELDSKYSEFIMYNNEIVINNSKKLFSNKNKDFNILWIYYFSPSPFKLNYYYIDSILKNDKQETMDNSDINHIIYIINESNKLLIAQNNYIPYYLILRLIMIFQSFSFNIYLYNIIVQLSLYSFFIDQLRIRINQIHYIIQNYIEVINDYYDYKKEKRKKSIEYMNTLWIIINDWIIGILFYQFIKLNINYIQYNFINKILLKYLILKLNNWMDWLIGYPAGLKINDELSSFLGELFIWLIKIWEIILTLVINLIPQFIQIILIISLLLGFSCTLGLIFDLIYFMLNHLNIFYLISNRFFRWQIILIESLFNLFRGKKYNVIKNRIESSLYHPDQLILGTILFTFLIFLFPTIMVYYFTFAILKLILVYFFGIFQLLLFIFNHFPLFAIILKIKNPNAIANGIQFDLIEEKLIMKSSSVSFKELFSVYNDFFSYINEHYFSSKLYLSLLIGKPLDRKPKFRKL